MSFVVFLVAVVIVPATIGFTLRRWTALAVVFALWVGLMVAVAAEWGLDSDDVPAEGLISASALLVLLPAEAIAALAVIAGRSKRPRV